MYRIRKVPAETDDVAAERGWWIAAAKQSSSALYTQSLQHVQAKNMDMLFSSLQVVDGDKRH